MNSSCGIRRSRYADLCLLVYPQMDRRTIRSGDGSSQGSRMVGAAAAWLHTPIELPSLALALLGSSAWVELQSRHLKCSGGDEMYPCLRLWEDEEVHKGGRRRQRHGAKPEMHPEANWANQSLTLEFNSTSQPEYLQARALLVGHHADDGDGQQRLASRSYQLNILDG